MKKGDFIFTQEVYELRRVKVSSPYAEYDWSSVPTGIIETHYVVDGKDYKEQADVVEYMIASGFSVNEAVEYIGSLPREDWGPRRLTLEESIRFNRELKT